MSPLPWPVPYEGGPLTGDLPAGLQAGGVQQQEDLSQEGLQLGLQQTSHHVRDRPAGSHGGPVWNSKNVKKLSQVHIVTLCVALTKHWIKQNVVDRPGVAGAVLQTASFIHNLVSKSSVYYVVMQGQSRLVMSLYSCLCQVWGNPKHCIRYCLHWFSQLCTTLHNGWKYSCTSITRPTNWQAQLALPVGTRDQLI